MTTGPEGIVRTTWKFTALANVGTRTMLPWMTGTPVRSSTYSFGCDDGRRGAHPHGRKPHGHSLGMLDTATVTCSCSPTPQLLRAVPSICTRPSCCFVRDFHARNRGGAAGDFHHVAGTGADAPQVGRSKPRNGASHILNASFRNAQSERGRVRGGVVISVTAPPGTFWISLLNRAKSLASL